MDGVRNEINLECIGISDIIKRLVAAERKITRLEDIEAIKILTRAYGYFIDKGMWDHVVDLFADESTVEIEAGGIFIGKKGADMLFRKKFGKGEIGFKDGVLFNHPQFQGIVTIDPDGINAKGRWRTLAQVSWHGERAYWNEGTYENEYIKIEGIWQYKKLKFWSTFFTDYEVGWAKQEIPPIGWGANMPCEEFPADYPSDPKYRMYPHYFVPPYHYNNPVSGRAVKIPENGK